MVYAGGSTNKLSVRRVPAHAQYDDVPAAPNVGNVLSALAIDPLRKQLSASAITQGRETDVCTSPIPTAGLDKSVQRRQRQPTQARNVATAKYLGTTFSPTDQLQKLQA
jgi:hypothetical protein